MCLLLFFSCFPGKLFFLGEGGFSAVSYDSILSLAILFDEFFLYSIFGVWRVTIDVAGGK